MSEVRVARFRNGECYSEDSQGNPVLTDPVRVDFVRARRRVLIDPASDPYFTDEGICSASGLRCVFVPLVRSEDSPDSQLTVNVVGFDKPLILDRSDSHHLTIVASPLWAPEQPPLPVPPIIGSLLELFMLNEGTVVPDTDVLSRRGFPSTPASFAVTLTQLREKLGEVTRRNTKKTTAPRKIIENRRGVGHGINLPQRRRRV